MTRVYDYAGSFAGDKDAAASIREEKIRPALAKGNSVILDFKGVDFATQSFIHALLAAVIRENPATLELLDFRNCNDDVRSLIEIVVEYAQEEFQWDDGAETSGGDDPA
ncbi:STAS-like domain-containing protein [Kribbella sp. NPDC051137]|uniref:STAS-like domain-containing protein n=1 Tax=Kribbella sp. NPDC051137 TaxID=3155045 RepID=UPI003413B050